MTNNSIPYVTMKRTQIHIFFTQDFTLSDVQEFVPNPDSWQFNTDTNRGEKQIPLDTDSDTTRMGTISVSPSDNCINIRSFEPVDSRLLYQRVKDLFQNFDRFDEAGINATYECDFSHPLVSFLLVRDIGAWKSTGDIHGLEYVEFDLKENNSISEQVSAQFFENGDLSIHAAVSMNIANEALHELNKRFRDSLQPSPSQFQINELQNDWAELLFYKHPEEVVEEIVFNWETIGTEFLENTDSSVSNINSLLPKGEPKWSKTQSSLCFVDTLLSVTYGVMALTPEEREAFYNVYTDTDTLDESVSKSIFLDIVLSDTGEQLDEDTFINNAHTHFSELMKTLHTEKHQLEHVKTVLDSYETFDMTQVERGTTWELHANDALTVQITHKDHLSEVTYPHEPVWWARVTETNTDSNADSDMIGKEVMFNPNLIV